MIIYNVTITIEPSIHKKWLVWINNHINEVLKTKRFTKAIFTKVLTNDIDQEITYSIQYYAKSKSELEAYIEKDSVALKLDGINKFGNQMLAFRTKLEFIKEFKLNSFQ